MAKQITNLTKESILNLLKNGIENPIFDFVDRIDYYGRIPEIQFLKRLYDIDSMPSSDSRYPDMESDILQHTFYNDDWETYWVLTDERLPIVDGEDEEYLRFISEIFHPEVRKENGSWQVVLSEINHLLHKDGYQLYAFDNISGRDVYRWSFYTEKVNEFPIPFSQRNNKQNEIPASTQTGLNENRTTFIKFLKRYDIAIYETIEGFTSSVKLVDKVLEQLDLFFDGEMPLNGMDTVELIIKNNDLIYLLDIFELFAYYSGDTKFEMELNELLSAYDILIRMKNGKFKNSALGFDSNFNPPDSVENGVRNLYLQAINYFDSENLDVAVEKIWDCLSRLKTITDFQQNKKESVKQLIKKVATSEENKQQYEELFDREFTELTKIGNQFRIRHHETNIAEITDKNHKVYFFNRCSSLVYLVLHYL